VIRTALGLFLRDELEGEERLAVLEGKRERLTRELEDKRREPQFRVNLYEHQLRQSLKAVLPDEQDIDSRPFRSNELLPEDLERLTRKAASRIEGAISDLEQKHSVLQAEIDGLGVEVRRLEDEVAELDSFFGMKSASRAELDAATSGREKARRELGDHGHKKCTLGGVLFRDCTHIQKRQSLLQITEAQDAQAMRRAQAERAEEMQRLEEDRAECMRDIRRLQTGRADALSRRDGLRTEIDRKRDGLRDLTGARDQLDSWIQSRDRPGGYEGLDSVRQQLHDTEREIERTERQLAGLLGRHDRNRRLLESIFSAAVQAVLSSRHYEGEVALENRELHFRIRHGAAMSGEAVDTLSVLLSDLAALVYSTVSEEAHHPGFVVHDSPREADLGVRIYRSFIRFVAALQNHFGGPDQCPFQYIITTTTPAPPELQTSRFVKLHLDATKPSGLLLRRNVATPPDEADMFQQSSTE